MTIDLPKKPDGHQYEEAMAAAVRAMGYFTESRTILDHGGREVLELDVVASPATEAFAAKILLDAKKSSAGFSDIFKIYGWRVFLKIPKGCIVQGVEADLPAQRAFDDVCPKLEVYVAHFDIGKEVHIPVVPVVNEGVEDKLRKNAREIGWYQFIAERLCARDFHDLKKEHQDELIFKKVQRYKRACHLAFFESDPLRRVELLYRAYTKDTNISGAAVAWQASHEGKEAATIWTAVRDSAKYPWIQYVLSLETKARILIIKNGLEAALNACVSGEEMKTFWKRFKLAHLPATFRVGFERLSASPNKHAIPFILQIYVELFGGFIIDDYDRENIAEIAGKPVDAVLEALEILDEFYPIGNGWHTASKEVKMLKMVPAYLRGIGAFFRQEQRGLKGYSEIAPEMDWLISKWHNAAFEILSRELAVKETTKKISV